MSRDHESKGIAEGTRFRDEAMSLPSKSKYRKESASPTAEGNM